MATFKAVVLRHQKRKDGRFSIAIRITQNRNSTYIKTGLYVTKSQINKKTFEIKDQFIIERTNATIREYENRLLGISTIELRTMSADEVKQYLIKGSSRIDYLAYCHKLVDKNLKKWISLRSALHIIEEEMKIERMFATDFTASFIRKFKEVMDNREVNGKQKDGKVIRMGKMKQKTKECYLRAVCAAFRSMCNEYNTEFNQVISHNPFIGFVQYKQEATRKRAMSVEVLRQFFNVVPKTPLHKLTQDVMRISFCLCGINVADLFALTHNNFDRKEKRINYERQKTKGSRSDNAYSSIRVEPEIEYVISRYITNGKDTDKLFQFGNYTKIDTLDRSLGNGVWAICEQMGLDYHMSPYWFRHTWATIARNDCDISKDDIDLCLNHVGNNKMADVYIKPDWSRIDRANRKVLDFVFGEQKEQS